MAFFLVQIQQHVRRKGKLEVTGEVFLAEYSENDVRLNLFKLVIAFTIWFDAGDERQLIVIDCAEDDKHCIVS